MMMNLMTAPNCQNSQKTLKLSLFCVATVSADLTVSALDTIHESIYGHNNF